MKIPKLLLVGLAASSASAHHVLTSFLVNGERQYNVIRQPGTVSPIIDPNSADLACGFPPGNGQGMKGTDKAIIKPGSKLTFEWHTNWSADTPGPDGVTDVSHKGPCAIYMRKVANSVSAIAEDPGSPGWFKIWEDGVDNHGVFCTTRMRENGGFFSGFVPKGLQEGDYLIRAETITLNNAAEPHNQPQWYIGCAQVALKSSPPPSISPPTIRIPSGDYANLNMPGLRYNIWYPERESYPDYGPVPGPAVVNLSSEGTSVGRPAPPGSGNSGNDKHIGDGTTTKVTKSKVQNTKASTDSSTMNLPDGFSTIPWPTTSEEATITSTITRTTNIVTSTSTSTIMVIATRSTVAIPVKTVTLGLTKTIYVTRTHPATHKQGNSQGHIHYKTVTVTHIVTQTVPVGGSATKMPAGEFDTATPTMPVPTGDFMTAVPTSETSEATTTTTGLYARHMLRMHGYQYRHWHRGHAGMRRRRF
ncbi:hypothetical protein ABW21_db0204755 [Orbilia brochopaga]|nr:hypothetical protein ABW21_db0204755 [Drechslerella brochopaga]